MWRNGAAFFMTGEPSAAAPFGPAIFSAPARDAPGTEATESRSTTATNAAECYDVSKSSTDGIREPTC